MKYFYRIFLVALLLTVGLNAGREYPGWFVYPRRYPQIVVGYNYRDVSVYDDAAANYCVMARCVVKGNLYQYATTEKRFSDYCYYYDKERFERVLDSLNYLKTYIINTFPLNLISAFSMKEIELEEVWYDFDAAEIPKWTQTNFYQEGMYYYGVGVYTSTGNDVDAWKTAEEHSFFALVTGYRTSFSSEENILKEENVDILEREQRIRCEYRLRDLQICERYADNNDDLFYVLSRIEKRNIKLGKQAE